MYGCHHFRSFLNDLDVPGQHKQVLPGRGEVFGWFTRFLSYTGKGRAFCLLLNFGHGPWCVGHVRSQCLDQRSNLCPLHGKCWVLTTGPPRKSHIFFNKWHPFYGGVERRGKSPDCTILFVSDTLISLLFPFPCTTRPPGNASPLSAEVAPSQYCTFGVSRIFKLLPLNSQQSVLRSTRLRPVLTTSLLGIGHDFPSFCATTGAWPHSPHFHPSDPQLQSIQSWLY